MKDKLKYLQEKLMNQKNLRLIILVVLCIIGALLIVNGTMAIYIRVNSKYLECTYESAVSDYSKLKIEETITNVFVKNKRSKMIHKSAYTILNKDKDTLESMKKDKKMYVSTYDDIKSYYEGYGYTCK